MEFKSQEEYEKEKARWNSGAMRDRSPAGYERFLDAERAWEDKVERDKIKAELEKKGSTTKNVNSNATSLKITGDGSGYKGETMKINPSDLEFKGYNKVMTGKDIEDPGTKFAKKGNYKKYLDRIEGKFYDQDGNLLVPKFDMPDRVKLSEEQKAANNALDSQFDDNGFYKTEDLKMPKMTKKAQWRDKRFRTYQKAGRDLARRMGIAPGIPSRKFERLPDKGIALLNKQASRYSKSATTPTLTIPDYSLSGQNGKNMMKIGQQNMKLSGMRT